MAFGLTTYADASRREDLLDAIRYSMPNVHTALQGQEEGLAQRVKSRKQSRQKFVKRAKLLSKWMKLKS